MNTKASATSEASSRSDRFREEIERAFQRTVKGVEYLTTPEPSVGLTPKHVLHRRGTQRVVHYLPLSDEVYRVPLLLVPPPSNHGYGLDMTPGQSLAEYLLKAGFDVYLLDWVAPRAEESTLKLDDYVLDFIPDTVARILKDTGESQISILGYCAGGLMSACYAALTPDGPLKNLVCLTTPIDFEHMSLHRNLTDPRHFDVDQFIDMDGNVSGQVFLLGTSMLRPVTRIADRIKLWDNLWDDSYVRQFRMFDRWATDNLPVPAGYMRQLVKDLLVENRLLKSELVLGRRKVRLGDITASILHAVAEHDHIVPRGASKPLIEMVGSEDKEELVLKGGHVSVVLGPNAVNRLWPRLETWLGSRSE